MRDLRTHICQGKLHYQLFVWKEWDWGLSLRIIAQVQTCEHETATLVEEVGIQCNVWKIQGFNVALPACNSRSPFNKTFICAGKSKAVYVEQLMVVY